MSQDFDGPFKKVKTRSPHECFGCGREITVGSIAESSSGKYDGEMYRQYAHIECANHMDKCEDCQDALRDEDVFPGFLLECDAFRAENKVTP